MADVSRQEKLASAKKKLKQFQQRRTPKAKKTEEQLPPASKDQDAPLLSPPVIELTGRNQNPAQTVLFPSNQEKIYGDENASSHNQTEKRQVSQPGAGETKHQPAKISDSSHHDKMIVTTHAVPNDGQSMESESSPAEKIKQISKQLNGLISEDVFVNGDDPIIKEMQALEGRNSELEQALQSFKRSNQQLSKQVNDQRKQVIQLQEQLRKERGEHSGKQQQEHSAMKEQLQVHIQTIGILVSEKSELQTNVASLQRKLQTKTTENEDVSSRLQAVRQRVVELERNAANLQMTCDKHSQTQREILEEKDKAAQELQNMIKEKDELQQQNSELREKLQLKVDECDVFESQVNGLKTSLQKAELVAHQLAPDSEQSDVINKLHEEKDELKNKIVEEQNRCQRLSDEYQQIRERYREHTEQLEKQIEALQVQVTELDMKETSMLKDNEDLVAEISRHRQEIAEWKAKASNAATDTTNETKEIVAEKDRLEQELDIQIQENRRLGREVLEKEDKILELETEVTRAQGELVDRATLLESIQSDKETISRAVTQNKQLKDQLEELQEGFVRMTNSNAEATNSLQNEQHLNKELATKLSGMVVELEELRQQLSTKEKAIEEASQTINELRSTQESTTSSKEAELGTLREEIVRLNERLEEQLELNDRLKHMEARAELTDRLQIELQSAQDNINQITTHNTSLREMVAKEQEKNIYLEEQVERLEEHALTMHHLSVNDKQETSKHFIQSPTPNSLEASTEHSSDSSDTAMEARKMEAEMESDEEDSDSASKDNTGHFLTLEEEEKVQSLHLSIENLTNEREELIATLEQERESANIELGRLREHMHLQLQQQLQLQNRQLHEHFHQQLHEHQLRLNSLQETIDMYKKQEELTDKDLNENNISYETIKTAFRQLQVRFKKLMEEKASLSDRIQDMEHKNLQLSIETETIGEYISLYHTQRQALKDKFFEKDRLISQLSNEHGRMQVKINQLQQLVSKILEERSGMELEKRQLQELVNKRLALQSGSDRSTEVPKLNYSLESLFGESAAQDNADNYESETESTLKSLNDATLEIKAFEEPNVFETPRKDSTDGTALQIRQLFEQLGKSGEGFQHGWLSPALRRKEFTPCINCSHRLINL